MSFGLKYRFTYQDVLGRNTELQILKEDYIGSVIDIQKMGGSPVVYNLSGEGDDLLTPIKGSELVLDLLVETKNQYEDLYDTTKRKYVKLYKNSLLVWQGEVLIENQILPYGSLPYKLQVAAVDGLGMMKFQDFKDGDNRIYGRKSLLEIVSYCIQNIGLDYNVNISVDLFHSEMTTGEDPFDETFVDATRFLDDLTTPWDCYRVLESILKPFNAQIRQVNGEFHIVRLSQLQSGSYSAYRYNSSGAYIGQVSYTSLIKQIQTDLTPTNSLQLEVIQPLKSCKIKQDLGERAHIPEWNFHNEKWSDVNNLISWTKVNHGYGSEYLYKEDDDIVFLKDVFSGNDEDIPELKSPQIKLYNNLPVIIPAIYDIEFEYMARFPEHETLEGLELNIMMVQNGGQYSWYLTKDTNNKYGFDFSFTPSKLKIDIDKEDINTWKKFSISTRNTYLVVDFMQFHFYMLKTSGTPTADPDNGLLIKNFRVKMRVNDITSGTEEHEISINSKVKATKTFDVEFLDHPTESHNEHLILDGIFLNTRNSSPSPADYDCRARSWSEWGQSQNSTLKARFEEVVENAYNDPHFLFTGNFRMKTDITPFTVFRDGNNEDKIFLLNGYSIDDKHCQVSAELHELYEDSQPHHH